MEDRPDAIGAVDAGPRAFEEFLEFVPDAIVGIDGTGRIVLVNRQAEDLFGYPREHLIGQTLELLVPDRFREVHTVHRSSYFERPRRRPMGAGVELFAVRSDGEEFPVEVSLSHLELGGETIAAAAIRDVSERAESERERALQGQLQRSQRLETAGRLAGGIAHDFNNLLGVIMNYAEFVADELEPDARAQSDVEEIRRAAERAAALTRQLLTFSRRDLARPEVLEPAALIGELENLLARALGEQIAMTVSIDRDLNSIEADPSQIEQILVNLALNARDAMPDGGRLLIEAENVELDDEYAYMHPDTAPGRYVRIKVSDTGVGMSRETAERIFEPFFTTKSEGAGFGLATAHGIVTGAGGRIDVYSEPGFGTTVKIHLPAIATRPEAPHTAAPKHRGGRGELVLVVEDEPSVKRMAERILSKGGYSVIGATQGAEAIELCRDSERSVDLLLTDVIMPDLLGTELAERLREAQPGLRVVYMSGYSHDVLAAQALTESDAGAFVEKPFSARALLATTRELLDRPASPTA